MDYLNWLACRSEDLVSDQTIRKYQETMVSFLKSLTLHDLPHTLGNLNARTMRQWMADQRAGVLPQAESYTTKKGTVCRRNREPQKCKEGSIGPQLAALKAFSHKFIHRELKWTKVDLLEEVARLKYNDPTKPLVPMEEINSIRGNFEEMSQNLVILRDRAMFEIHMDTGLRYGSVLGIKVEDLDHNFRSNGQFTTTIKGGEKVPRKLMTPALRRVRAYMSIRPQCDTPELFVQNNGNALSYDGATNIWRRIQKRTGIIGVGSHDLRYTVAQTAVNNGPRLPRCKRCCATRPTAWPGTTWAMLGLPARRLRRASGAYRRDSPRQAAVLSGARVRLHALRRRP